MEEFPGGAGLTPASGLVGGVQEPATAGSWNRQEAKGQAKGKAEQQVKL